MVSNALNHIEQSDIDEIKVFKNPPPAVYNVIKVICILLKIEPASINNPQTMQNEYDYWQPSV